MMRSARSQLKLRPRQPRSCCFDSAGAGKIQLEVNHRQPIEVLSSEGKKEKRP
jgi:hypothetical protein